jgi:hypothetical protein
MFSQHVFAIKLKVNIYGEKFSHSGKLVFNESYRTSAALKVVVKC